MHHEFPSVPLLPDCLMPSFCHKLTSRRLPVPDWKLLGITYGSPRYRDEVTEPPLSKKRPGTPIERLNENNGQNLHPHGKWDTHGIENGRAVIVATGRTQDFKRVDV
ncbi:hypothetical protein EYF80_010599 [Liparis tanakae]|uniref:Uncharacterized protein n=1 Tax=Liparis tanakae TaxID=230148 RepID=A0A4Z2IMY9_9TELE|nr:hypothetical protein EYF80_010599 [Liparis tanakae]